MSYMDPNIEPEAQDNRAPRQRRLIRAQLTDRFNNPCDIVIRNVSEKGIGASTQGPAPAAGEQVFLSLPGGATMNGVVRWVDGQTFGIELDRDLDLAVLADAVQRRNETPSDGHHWEVRRLHQVPTQHVDPSRLRKI